MGKRARQQAARQAQRRVEISAVLITKDEAAHIADLAASLDGAVDEVVLLDTGSADDTVALARAHGFRVFHRPWTNHFADARNAALAHARGRWILWIDADERLICDAPGELRHVLADATARDEAESIDAIWVTLDSFSSDDLDPVTARRVQQKRLFRASKFHFEGRIHEQLVPNVAGSVRYAQAPGSIRIDHLGYTPAIWERKHKAARNAELTEMFERELVERAAPGDAFALARAKFEKARIMFARSPHEGLELLLESLPSMPEDSEIRRLGALLVAEALIDQGRCDEALGWLKRTAMTEMFATSARIVAATALARAGRDDEAIEALRQIQDAPGGNSSKLDMEVRLPALLAETLAVSGRPIDSWRALVALLPHGGFNLAPTAAGIAERAWKLAAREGCPDRYLVALSEATDDEEFRKIQFLLTETHERAALGARHVLTREPITEPDPRLAQYRPKLAGYSASAVIALAQTRLDTEPALALGVAQTIEDRPNASAQERDAAALVAIRALLMLNHVEAAVKRAAELPDNDRRLDADKDFLATVTAMARELQVAPAATPA